MRTTRSNSHPGGLHQAPSGSRHPQEQTPPHVNRILDTRLWKYYLPQTSFAGGNKKN